MRNIVLTGFLGTGKTTVGRILAQTYGLEFVDTDALIESRAGCPISSIFERDGEKRFRDLEQQVVRELTPGEGRVIATGGGTLMAQATRKRLTASADVFCLSCESRELERRLEGNNHRPLVTGGTDLQQVLDERQAIYSLFPQLDTTRRSPTEVAEAIGKTARLDLLDESQLATGCRSQVIFRRSQSTCLDQVWANDLGKKIILVTDDVVDGLPWMDSISSSLSAFEVSRIVLPASEEQKDLGTLETLYDFCLQERADRKTTVLAIGGGVVTDIAGMLAATYLRGLSLVLVPTTLLAQVDAAIGGKVAVDFAGVKNIVGSFYPARLTVIDPDVLDSLSDDQLADGLAEVIKIAAMRSGDLTRQLAELSAPSTVHERPDLIRRAALEKLRLVREDPYEQGERALLNFGHTVGHALEAASDFRLSHGQAVAIGMTAETRLATSRSWCEPSILPWLADVFTRFNLPEECSSLDGQKVRQCIWHDKKRREGTITMALPVRLGEGVLKSVTEADLEAAIDFALGKSS